MKVVKTGFMTLLLLNTHCKPQSEKAIPGRIYSSVTNFPADGYSSGRIIVDKGEHSSQIKILELEKEYSTYIEIYKKEETEKKIIWYFKSTLNPGAVSIRTTTGHVLKLNFYNTGLDTDSDGFPDHSELRDEQDRKNFIRWFIQIANSQLLKPNYSWNRQERDCSGLIRYAYREALKKHGENWYKKNGIILEKNLPDINAFHYPEVPVIGKKIFKISSSKSTDLKSFNEYADAEHLMKYNSRFISRDTELAKEGDILFFFNPENQEQPYHSMIITKVKPYKIVLYHTGSTTGIKSMEIGSLDGAPKFTPKKFNPNFLGVYRFHIVD